MTATRFLVSGRVQGVGFRAATRARAQALGLAGRVRNLDDGRVEVLARGHGDALDALAAWLHAGPPSARVTDVQRDRVEECEPDARDGRFVIA